MAAYGATGISAFVAFVALLNRRHIRSAQRSSADRRGGPGCPPPELNLERLFADLQKERATTDVGAGPALAEMIVKPDKYRLRTVESISLRGRVIGQKVSVEFLLPPERESTSLTGGAGGAAHEVCLPILMARKPVLVDSMSITDGQGQMLSVLSYEESIRFMAVTLHFLVLMSLRHSRNDACRSFREGQQMPLPVWLAERPLLNLVCQVKPATPEEVDSAISQAFSILELPQGLQRPQRLNTLAGFVRALSQAYPLIVAIARPEGSRVTVAYQRTLVPTLKVDGPRGRLRLALGLRPLKVSVETTRARNSREYHLKVDGPEKQYLMEQTITCQGCGGNLTRDGVESIAVDSGRCPSHRRFDGDHLGRPYYELRPKLGQSYSFLYMRGFSSVPETLQLSASFGEAPPGTLISAMITATISCLLIGVIGHSESSGIGYDSDISALLLAMPAAAASWFGFHSDGEAILRSSLVARLSLIIGGITSLLAVSVYLGTDRSKATGPISLDVFSMRVPGMWSLLLFTAFANALCVLAHLLIRSWTYRRLLVRKERDDIHPGTSVE